VVVVVVVVAAAAAAVGVMLYSRGNETFAGEARSKICSEGTWLRGPIEMTTVTTQGTRPVGGELLAYR
jgi:hypothetical protein